MSKNSEKIANWLADNADRFIKCKLPGMETKMITREACIKYQRGVKDPKWGRRHTLMRIVACTECPHQEKE